MASSNPLGNGLRDFLLYSIFNQSKLVWSISLHIFLKWSQYIFLVFLDDIILIGSSMTLLKNVITKLNLAFLLKYLSDLDYFLGIKVKKYSLRFLFLIQSKYIREFLDTHMVLVKRILRYLKGTIRHGLHISPFLHITYTSLQVFCDDDWPSDPDDRRSTYGATIYFGNNLI